MKKIKEVTSLVLSAAMIAGLLAGCGGGNSSSAASEPDTSSDAPVADSAEDGQYTGEAEPLTLPLSEERKTITVYAKNSSSGVLSDYGDLKAFQEAADRLNVEIKWIMPASGSETDQFNLMIASGEYPDIIFWEYSTTAMGLTGLKEDGIIIEMDDLIRRYAPNYLAALESDSDMMLQALSDNGTYDCMYKLEPDPARLAHSGPTIRKDLLDKYNLDVPVTIDDWHNVLTVIKENEEGVTAPVTVIRGSDGSANMTCFLSAWQTYPGFHAEAGTGQVVYGPMTENWKGYLSTMAQWYDEGLIDPEFMTLDFSTLINNLVSGKSVAGYLMLGAVIGTVTNYARATNPDFEFVGAPFPVLNEGDTAYTVNYEANIRVGGMAGAVTSACEDPVLAVKLMDYFFSEEGSDLLNWGIEGESYTVEDGVKTYTDAVLNDPDGKSISEAVQQWAQPLQGFTKKMDYNAWSQITLSLDEQIAANQAWAKASTDLMLPNLELPADENSQYTKIMSDVTTYVNEMSLQFITGQLSVEDDWDTYVATLQSMNIDQALGYMQSAWERYNNRS